MRTILILGNKGMLGKMLIKIFSQDKGHCSLVTWDKEKLNITDKNKVTKAFKNLAPAIVINAAAYTNVDEAETNKNLAMKVNGKAVSYLAKAASKVGAFFIHISTDYVFGSEKKEGYKEEDIPQKPLNVYGESKLLGEHLLLKEAKQGLKYCLIRTSWLFGDAQRPTHPAKRGVPAKRGIPAPREVQGRNFVDTMLKLAKEHDKLKVVDDQYGRPTYTRDLAEMIKYMVGSKMESGIYHFTNTPTMTWYEFARLIFKVKKEIDPSFKAPKVVPVTSEEFPRKALRPHFSVLLNNKLPAGRDIRKALRDYLKQN